MAKKISELDSADVLAGLEPLPIVQTGVTKKATVDNIRQYVEDTIGVARPYVDEDNIGSDGLISAQDQAKLDSIESNATGDQTAQEIVTAIILDSIATTSLRTTISNPTLTHTFFGGF